MTTTTISTIKPAGGGTYTTLNAWYVGRTAALGGGNPNLITQDRIEVAEVYGGGNCITIQFDLNAWYTDSSHYIEIRAAVGQQHSGTWNTSKAYGSVSGSSCIFILSHDVNFIGMQFESISTTQTAVISQGSFNASSHAINIDKCILQASGTGYITAWRASPAATALHSIMKNSICIVRGANALCVWHDTATTIDIYNCTIIALSGSAYSTLLVRSGGVINSQNNYLHGPNALIYVAESGGTFNKGNNDATSDNEAVTSNLRSVPYSTATFTSVTSNSENLRPVISSSNKLLDHGANLISSGVTDDIVGTARPQFGTFDIGAFENDIPICWNYTARYKNSNKLFKASGCGSFPKNLRVPSNVDISTGRMVDDGIFINPDEYRVI